MTVRAAFAGCVLALALLCTGRLGAATLFDPALRFRTIATSHFVIYYHRGEETMARRLASIAEETWRALESPLGVRPPRRTHVVLADQTELANGYATPVPYDVIVIYTVWPAGSESIGNVDDWLRVAFTHEFTHVVHLDRSEGWARPVRGIFGRMTLAFPNLFLPTWQIEGLATYEESALTGEGRLHAGDFAAVVGEAARRSALEPLDRVNGGLTDWPGGAAPYAYGVGFHQYLAERFGAESLGALARDTARRLPYTGSRAFEHVYGEPLGDLWREYETTREARPAVVEGTRITSDGFVAVGPRFDRASAREIVYSTRNPDEFPAMYRVNIDTHRRERLATRYLGSVAAPGTSVIYFDQQEVRRNVGIYSDLYGLDRATGRIRTLTREARLMDPDLSPDGTTIVAVQDRTGGRDLVLVDVARIAESRDDSVGGAVRRLLSAPDTQFNAPRWSPDGRQVAVERHRFGALSEVVVVDVSTKEIRVAASVGGARVVTPAWRPDGAAILASVAPEEQPFNLYEFAVDGSMSPRQITHTTGGATWPDVSPDGRTIVYVGYTPSGFDLFALPYEGRTFRSDTPVRPAGQADRAVQAVQPDPSVRSGSQTDQSDRPYSPLPTLAPTSWTPIVASGGSQLRAGAAVGGSDVLGYHGYAASATWLLSAPAGATAPDSASPDWQVSYFYDRWRPTFFAAASRATSFFAGPPTDAGTPVDATLRQRELEAGLLLPFRHTRVSHTALVSALMAVDEYTLADRVETRDRTALRAAWASTNAHTYGYSISPEAGVAGGATIELIRRAFGSSGDATTITGDVRGYLPGLAPHHVIALRAAAGSSTGSATVTRTFLLGGSTTDLGVASFSSDAVGLLRGFPTNTFAGTHAAVINADYRWPLFRPQRGLGTWPIFIHTLHAAVFGDAGHAWTQTFRSSAIKTAAGAELSVTIVAGYVIPFTLATGAAWGRDPSGAVGDRATAYVRIGKAF